MTTRPAPTDAEIQAIEDAFQTRLVGILGVSVKPVVHVTISVPFDSDRNAVYDLESKVIREFPDIQFDFRVHSPSIR